jgi:hypothetical protein
MARAQPPPRSKKPWKTLSIQLVTLNHHAVLAIATLPTRCLFTGNTALLASLTALGLPLELTLTAAFMGRAHHRLHHSVTISEAQNNGTRTRSGTEYSLRMFHLRRHRCRSALHSQTRFPMRHSLSVRSCIRSADGKPANSMRQRVIRHSRKSRNPGIGLASTCLFDYLTTSLSFPRRRESRRRQHERKPWIPACAGMTVQ